MADQVISGIAMRPLAGASSTGTRSMSFSGVNGATSTNPATLTVGSFTVNAGPAAALRFVTNMPASVASGAAVTPAVTVEVIDAGGNRVTTATDSITLSGTGLTLTNDTATATAGIATFTGMTVSGLVSSGNTLTAAATGLTSATSTAFALTAGAANRLAFSVQPSTVTVGSNFSPQVQVTVQDSAGNTVTGSTASIALAGTGVTLGGTSTVNAVSGVATFSALTVSGTAGAGKTIAATSTGLTGATSNAFTLDPGTAAALAFSQQPAASVAVGNNFATAVAVRVIDASSNTVTGSTAAITLGGTGVTVNGTATVNASSGVATFSSVTFSGTAGAGKTLSATSTGLTAATSNSFTLNAGTATALEFSQQPSASVAVGSNFSPAVSVRVVDAASNTVTGSTASITLGGTGVTVNGTATVNATSGVATFSSVTMAGTAGAGKTLSATSSGLTSATSNSFTLNVGPAAALAFVQQPAASVDAGSNFGTPVSVRVVDASANTVTGSSASITLGGTGVTVSGTTSVNASAGVATFSAVTFSGTAGAGKTLSATSSGLTSATSNSFTLNPGPIVGLAFTQQPGNISKFQNFSPAVKVGIVDAFGNVVTSASATITLAPGASTGLILSGTYQSVATVNGEATFSAMSVSGGSGSGKTITAAASGYSTITSSAFSVDGFSLASPTTQWKTLLRGPAFDFINDQQATATDLELVGNQNHPVLYSQYDDGGTPGTVNESDDTVFFRVRMSGSKSTGSSAFSSGYLFLGCDVNLDGAIDFFISVTQRTTKESRVSIWSTGSGLNNSPNTTTIAAEIPLFGLLTEPGLSRFSFVPVTSVLDPTVTDLNLNTPAAELSGLTLVQQDHFLSIAIPFSNTTPAIDSYKEAAAAKGFSVNKDTPLNILLATSTQSNSMNSDINGYQGGTRSTTSFKDQGAFVPTRTFPNALPVITSNGGGDVGGVIYGGSNPVTTVTANDADSDALEYEISGGANAGLFSLNLTTGVLNFTNPSFNSSGSYEVIVRVYDIDPAYGTRRGNFDQQQLFITIADPGDTTSPTVLSVTSAKANGQYKAGEVIPVSVTFSEAVQVTGTPTITLSTAGTANRVVNYSSGTGSPVLVFNYTVQAGDTSSDLDYLSTGSLALNGGIIKDANNNNAVLTLPVPGAANSLGANKALIIDTTSPVFNLAASTASGTSLTLAFTDSNILDDSNLPLLSQFSVEVDPDGAGSSPYAPATVVGVSVQSAARTATVVLSSLIPSAARIRVAFTDPTVGVDDAITLQDRAGNDVASFGPSVINASVDTTKPRVLNLAAYAPDENGTPIYQNGHFPAGTVISLKVEWSEPVTLNEGVNPPSPRVPIHIHLNNGAIASYVSGSGTAVWTFNYTVQASVVTLEGFNPNYEKARLDYDAVNALMIHSDTVTDLAGNAPDLVGTGGGTGVSIAEPGDPTSLGANNEITIDTIKPTFVNAFLADAAVGSQVTLSFSDTNPLDAANPAAAARFSVTYGAGNTVATITGVSVSSSARQVILNISDELDGATANVKVSYTPESSNDANAVQDLAGNDSAAIVAQPVTNVIGNVTPPALLNVTHNSHASQPTDIVFTGDVIEYKFTFSKDIDLSTIAGFDFRNSRVSSPASFSVTSITEVGVSGEYLVTVVPSTTGFLDLRIAQGAVIQDHAGVAVDTSAGDLGAFTDNHTIEVTFRDQVITFPQPTSIVYGISPGFALGATASSGLPVTYTLNSGPVTLVDGFVTPIGVGEVSITATQAGDATHTPAQPVTRTFQVLILGSGTAPRMNIRSEGVSIRSGETKFLGRDNTDFGKYTIGEASPKTNVYTIENLGDLTLILNNVSAPVTLTNLSGSAAFRVVQPSFTSVLGGGRLTATTEDFSIVFEPTTAGVTEAEISIQNSDSNRSPYTFRIRGEAIASPAPTDLILVDNRVQHNVLSVAPSGTAAGLLSPVPVVGTDYTYSIVGGTDAALFNIPTGTNQLRLNIGQTPDIVAKPKYFVRIRVTRGAATFEKDFEVIVMTVASKEGDFVVNDRGPSDSGVDISGSGQILLVSKDSAGAAYVSQTYRTDIVDPYEIAVEADGDFIIANYEHFFNTLTLKPDGGIYRIDRITAERTKVTGNTGALGEVVLRTPLGVEVESDGNIIVADADYSPDGGTTFTGGVIRVNPSTGAKTLLASGGTLEYVQGIGLNPVSGEIYISNIRFPLTKGGQIVRVNKTTGVQTVITPSNGVNIVRFPVGIACEADGQSLVVADAFAQRLIKIDLTTGNQSYLTARPETLDPLSSEPKLDFPTHVAIEADGNYIVTDGRDDGRDRRVIRIDKGTGIASLIVADTENSFFDQPRGVRIAK